MRKTSQDGGDSTSITSGFDEHRKSTGLIKSTRSSIKRKVQNFSHESDDAVIEPLLQKEKPAAGPSSKFSLHKFKTSSFDRVKEDVDSESSLTTDINDLPASKAKEIIKSDLSNSQKVIITSSLVKKQPLLVDIDQNKAVARNTSSPLIFTTAKIFGDKNTQTHAVLTAPVPIISTVESASGKEQSTLGELSKQQEMSEQGRDNGKDKGMTPSVGKITTHNNETGLILSVKANVSNKDKITAKDSLPSVSFNRGKDDADKTIKMDSFVSDIKLVTLEQGKERLKDSTIDKSNSSGKSDKFNNGMLANKQQTTNVNKNVSSSMQPESANEPKLCVEKTASVVIKDTERAKPINKTDSIKVLQRQKNSISTDTSGNKSEKTIQKESTVPNKSKILDLNESDKSNETKGKLVKNQSVDTDKANGVRSVPSDKNSKVSSTASATSTVQTTTLKSSPNTYASAKISAPTETKSVSVVGAMKAAPAATLGASTTKSVTRTSTVTTMSRPATQVAPSRVVKSKVNPPAPSGSDVKDVASKITKVSKP